MLCFSENDAVGLQKDINRFFAVNVIGIANTVTVFLPLIKKGDVKKVVTLSSGMADIGESCSVLLDDQNVFIHEIANRVR